MASGLQSWVEDHSNITMFNFIAYPIFSKTHHDTDSKHPLQKTIKGKNSLSLSLSPSHLKEHNCLSLIKLQKRKKKKKLGEFSAFRVELRGKLCIPPTTMVWYCYNWKYKNPTTAATTTTTITKRNVSCVLIMHRSEWRLLHGSDLTLDSFLTMFIFVSLFCFSV